MKEILFLKILTKMLNYPNNKLTQIIMNQIIKINNFAF